MRRFAVLGCLLALALAGCSWLPSDGPDADTVVDQGKRAEAVQFDVVKVDDHVLATLAARPQDSFHARFKQYQTAPSLKIAVGDTLRVVIWESATGGLFGESLSGAGAFGGHSAAALSGSASTEMLRQLLSGLPSTSAATPEGAAAIASELLGFGPDGRIAAGATPGTQAQGGEAAQQALIAELQSSMDDTGRPGAEIPDQQVDTEGEISIPYAGRVPVAGRTPNQVQHIIQQRLTGKALDPQVLVLIADSEANSVTISGETVKGGRIPLSAEGLRLLQVIAAAGGSKTPAGDALDTVSHDDGTIAPPRHTFGNLLRDRGGNAAVHDTFVILSRDGVSATMPLATLVANPAEDIYARPGDILTLVNRPRIYSVFGATGENKAITFGAETVNVSEALARAGGLLDQQADPRGVFLFRYEPVPIVRALGQPVAADVTNGVSPIVYRFDLNDPKSYLHARQFALRDKDILFVSNAKVVPLYKFFALLSNITGPVETGFLTCYEAKCR